MEKFSNLWKVSAIILFLGLTLIIWHRLSLTPLKDYDESIYAQVAKQAFQRHQYLSFKWQGNTGLGRNSDWFEKPPLMIWLLAVNYKILGINELSSRLWDDLFALASIALSAYFAKKIAHSWLAASMAIGCFYLCFQYIDNASVLQFDIPVGFFILGALIFFSFGLEKSKFFYLFGIFLALGTMTKSVIGLLPLPIIGLYILFEKNFNFLKIKEFWYGILLFLALAVPWHLYETARYGRLFWDQYLFYHLLERFATTLENNGGGWNYYLQILQSHHVLFYSSIIAIICFFYKAWKNKQGAYLLTAVAVIFILLFFSLAKTKLPAYLLIIYPWLAIMNGVTWYEAVAFLSKKQNFKMPVAGFVFVFICLFFGLRYNNYKNNLPIQQWILDDHNIGSYLKSAYLSYAVYDDSKLGTKPAVIFYSNRTIYSLAAGNTPPTTFYS